MSHFIAEIVIDGAVGSFDKRYTYAVPDDLQHKAQPGSRVTVPFGIGNSKKQGMILKVFEGDISSNIARRINNNVLSSRKLARMEINKEYSLVSGEKVFLENFNFEYVVVSNKSTLRNELQIVLKPGLVMECYKVSGNLFKVDNLDELQDNPDFKIIVSEWDMYEE